MDSIHLVDVDGGLHLVDPTQASGHVDDDRVASRDVHSVTYQSPNFGFCD